MVKTIYRQRKADAALAPKPVKSTAIEQHALFGPVYVRQHMMIDDAWKNEDLIEEYELMSKLLKSNLTFQNLDKTHRYRKLHAVSRNLRRQVRVGRSQLQMAKGGHVQQQLRLIFVNHKDMQRLYANMSMHEVLESITHRTFIMHKERDRCESQMLKLGKEMELKKLEKGRLENRLRYFSSFHLQEEVALHELNKQIENSHTRLQSLQTINQTYKKVVQVLHNDGIFHDPILEALSNDLKDLQAFINQIIHIGLPAIERFKQLKHESWQTDEMLRKQRQSKSMWSKEMKRISMNVVRASTAQVNKPLIAFTKRNVRETSSMLIMKSQLMDMEKKMQRLQEVTLCSRAQTLYPTFKQQLNLNFNLKKKATLTEMRRSDLQNKTKYALQKKQSILNEFYGRSQKREEHISHLRQLIKEEEQKESECLTKIQEHTNLSVVLRCSLWNAFDILRHVQLKGDPKIKPTKYANSYMRLPLLKFEQLEMKAVPPHNFEENTHQILNIVKQKLEKVMDAYDEFEEDFPEINISDLSAQYQLEFLASIEPEDVTDLAADKPLQPLESKSDITIPTHAFIKEGSSKMVQEHLKKDD